MNMTVPSSLGPLVPTLTSSHSRSESVLLSFNRFLAEASLAESLQQQTTSSARMTAANSMTQLSAAAHHQRLDQELQLRHLQQLRRRDDAALLASLPAPLAAAPWSRDIIGMGIYVPNHHAPQAAAAPAVAASNAKFTGNVNIALAAPRKMSLLDGTKTSFQSQARLLVQASKTKTNKIMMIGKPLSAPPALARNIYIKKRPASFSNQVVPPQDCSTVPLPTTTMTAKKRRKLSDDSSRSGQHTMHAMPVVVEGVSVPQSPVVQTTTKQQLCPKDEELDVVLAAQRLQAVAGGDHGSLTHSPKSVMPPVSLPPLLTQKALKPPPALFF